MQYILIIIATIYSGSNIPIGIHTSTIKVNSMEACVNIGDTISKEKQLKYLPFGSRILAGYTTVNFHCVENNG